MKGILAAGCIWCPPGKGGNRPSPGCPCRARTRTRGLRGQLGLGGRRRTWSVCAPVWPHLPPFPRHAARLLPWILICASANRTSCFFSPQNVIKIIYMYTHTHKKPLTVVITFLLLSSCVLKPHVFVAETLKTHTGGPGMEGRRGGKEAAAACPLLSDQLPCGASCCRPCPWRVCCTLGVIITGLCPPVCTRLCRAASQAPSHARRVCLFPHCAEIQLPASSGAHRRACGLQVCPPGCTAPAWPPAAPSRSTLRPHQDPVRQIKT